ncbi:sodium:solute symporter [Nitrincola tibetensis]|uniref:Sodium:solute symporter n=1 Tax=Nitrincola tibetensis TaxID=2219697 RepID=A0A364NK31_9GAMM|nr:SLC13 family permease [Nitrincola tibetensis]RAU17436.1 sodium:solute symporter [Nitrincola tibetensis]
MTADMIFVFTLLGATIALFLSNKIRMDTIALLVVIVLALSGIITPSEAVSGFGNSVVIMIAGLFVIGEGLFRTGVAATAGNWLLKVGGDNEQRLLMFLLPVVALLSAFMSSTGAVALLIPVVLSMARKSGMQPSRLLMPLAFAALIGGMLTLIGTPPNIIVSAQMRDAGFEPFGFFAFTPIGLAILIVGTLYLVFIARHLLPKTEIRDPDNSHPSLIEFSERYATHHQLHKLIIQPESQLAFHTLADLGLRSEYEVTVVGIQRKGTWLSSLMPVLANTQMRHLDILWAYGDEANIHRLCQALHLRSLDFHEAELAKVNETFGLAEVLLPPSSTLVNLSLKECRFREKHNLSVIGVRRNRTPLNTEFSHTKLEAGDTLLLAGSWQHIQQLERHRDFVVLETPAEMQEIPATAEKAPIALVITLGLLITMTFGFIANITAILIAALLMILSKCLSLNDAYKSLNASSLVLIAGMLPLALAMEKSGALSYVVNLLANEYGHASPLMLCAGFFLLTSLLSQFISNTATTVLIAPIALTVAQMLGIQPEPFMITVAIAASTAFATPIASPVNTLVVEPGQYRFADFAKVGIPLQLIALLITLILLPIFFPF